MTKARRPSVDCRYWDATVFLSWFLKNEPGRLPAIGAILDAAAREKVIIVTSVITLTEVIHLKGQPGLSRDHERTIRDFFAQPFIVLRGLDRFTAIEAREFVWKHNLKPKDATHVATAARAQLRVIETHDHDLLTLHSRIAVTKGGAISVRQPHYSETLPLFGNVKDIKDRKKKNGSTAP